MKKWSNIFLVVLMMAIVLGGCGVPGLGDTGKDKEYLHDKSALKDRMAELEKRTGSPLMILDLSIVSTRKDLAPNKEKKTMDINLISLFYQDAKNPTQSMRILYDHNNKNVPEIPGGSKITPQKLINANDIDYDKLIAFVAKAEEEARSKGYTDFHDEELSIKRDHKTGDIVFKLFIKGDKEALVFGDQQGEITEFQELK